MRITFKTKIRNRSGHTGAESTDFVSVPAIGRKHCDMNAFRNSRRFGNYANSDLFPAILKRELKRLNVGDWFYLHSIPESVSVDDSGFLAVVTINVPDSL